MKPSEKSLASRTFKEKKAITKRLGLGLIVVDVALDQVTFLIDPSVPTILKDRKKRRRLDDEFLLRQTALNEGGLTRTKIITAYRELALRIIDCLREGEKPVQAVVSHTGQLKATRVLIDNHYGWFKRVERGVYTLSEEGEKALDTYADVIAALE